jgi:chitodextrinase
VPVASTQIDITWSAATDDIAVSGYRLFRNNVQIATTTLLAYSDTGLTASTTYQYTVDAFDAAFNFSSTSPAISTTTLPIVVPPTPTSTPSTTSVSGTRATQQLVALTVTPTDRSALFTWDTNNPTQYILIWGRTTAYELGSVSGGVYKQNHSTLIDLLEPGTVYYYQLRAINAQGYTTILSADTFTTKNKFLIGTLENVRDFTVNVNNTDVRLSWQNIFSNPDYYVRIVRSHLFYPSTIQNGAVVYEGKGQSFVDTEALTNRSPQYYTIFVLDGSGNVSSGAVARAFVRTESVVGVTPTATNTEVISPFDYPAEIDVDHTLRGLDINILQLGANHSFGTEVELDAHQKYLISVPFAAVPKNLKSIIVTVQNPSDQRKFSSFLLKLNQAGDAYSAYIPGPDVVGRSKIIVELFDFEEGTVRRIATTVTFVESMVLVPLFPDRLLYYMPHSFGTIALGVSFWWLLVFKKRRRRDF